MKRQFFGGSRQSLHASRLKSPTSEQLKALTDFFQRPAFGRVAAVVTDRSKLDPPFSPYAYTAAVFLRRLESVCRWFPFDKVFIIFEASDRGDRLVARHFGDLHLVEEQDRAKVIVGTLAKSTVEPGLEVADFIMHAAGGQARSRLAGGTAQRKDFAAVFDVDERLASYLQIDSARMNHGAAHAPEQLMKSGRPRRTP